MALYSNRSSHNQIARLLKDACVAGGEKKKLLEGAGVSSAQLFPALESTLPIVLAESTTCLSTARGPKRICQLESCFYITPHNALRLPQRGPRSELIFWSWETIFWVKKGPEEEEGETMECPEL